VKIASSGFDRYTTAPTATTQQWMRDHYWRMVTFAPYFDTRLRWYPDASVYKDLYAVYPGQATITAHPDWVLRDATGAPLYIPYGCGGGTCPQYAGDVGNPAFRAAWIAQAVATVARGYRGLFVDDVNMAMMVSDGTGRHVAPQDPRTGAPMTLADWRDDVATFTEDIRAALPGVEIVHNQVWFFAPVTDPAVERAIAAADLINVERGFNDAGIRGGSGQFGFDTLLGYLDALHARGKGAILQSSAISGRDYALAAYFLVATERDGFAHGSRSLPDDWWPGWDVALGAPVGARYAWAGLVRRDFARGLVLVNPPDRAPQTVALVGAWRGLDGQPVTSVTLGAGEGIVLQPQ
jgi:putative glycosyl hydrolase-like family 15 (GHL15) protein